MSDATPDDVTRLLQAASGDDAAARVRLLDAVYSQLLRMAHKYMKAERPSHTLQATALVHEAYVKLVGGGPVEWASRAHFYVAAAEAMRRILVEYARGRRRIKRGGTPGGERRRLSLDVVNLAAKSDSEEILAVDEAVRRIEDRDPDLCRIVRLRFYAGLSEEEVADLLGLSRRTVRREWALARALLSKELDAERPD